MPELKITHDLMQHFKVMKTASKEKHMQAVCDQNGKAFLSIGDDGKLRITSDENMHIAKNTNLEAAPENSGSASGWLQKDLSKEILAQTGENSVIKAFSIGENQMDGRYVLCAVAGSGKQDAVFYSLSESASSPQWIKIDLPKEIAQLSISDIQINGCEDDLYILLYVKQGNDRLQRYFLRSSEGNFDQWSFLPLAADFDRIDSTVMGCPDGEVQGSYTLGKIKGEFQILFTPSYNVYSPGTAPAVSRFVMPQTGDARSSGIPDRLAAFTVPDTESATDLFACGNGALSVYACTDQEDHSKPVVLSLSEHFTAVEQLFTFTSKGRAYVWLLNASKELCYLYADVDKRYDPAAWSVVLVLRDGLDYVHMFQEDDRNAFYGYTSEGTGILGYEDRDNGLWSYQSVFTSVDTGGAVPIRAFVTHIKTPGPNDVITIKANGSGLFEINQRIYALHQGDKIRVKSSPVGTVNIVQLTELFYAIGFDVTSGSACSSVDPGKGTADKLLSLDSAQKLRNAKIAVAGEPNGQPLIPESTSDEDVNAAAAVIASLSAQNKRLNGANDVPPSDQGVRLRCYGNSLRIMSAPENETSDLMAYLDDMSEYGSEDVFAYLRSQFSPHSALMSSNGWFDIIIQTVDNVCRFIVKTVKKVVYCVIDCVEKIVTSVKEILTILVTDPGKILDFLKYMFDFKDIQHTKQYMKTLVNAKIDQCSDFIDQAKSMMEESFLSLEKSIAEWGGLDTTKMPKDTPGNMQARYANAYSDGDVHSNYFSNLVADNAKHADTALQASMTAAFQSNSLLSDILDQLRKFAETEGGVIYRQVEEIEQVIRSLKADANLDLGDIFKKLFAIMAKGMVSSVKGIAVLIFDIVKCLIGTIKDIINKKIYIPCISEFLQMLGIERFSMLDVVLFVPSFACTIIYKLINGHAPITQADISQLTGQLGSSPIGLQNLESESNSSVDIKELLTGLVLFFESLVALGGAATELVCAIMGLIVAVLEMPPLPEDPADDLEFVAFYFAILGVYVAFISVYLSSEKELIVKQIFAVVLVVFFLIMFIFNVVLCIKDFAVKMLSPVLDSLKVIIDNIIAATDMDKTKPDAALILRTVRIIIGAAAGFTLIIGATETSQNVTGHAPILV